MTICKKQKIQQHNVICSFSKVKNENDNYCNVRLKLHKRRKKLAYNQIGKFHSEK